MIFLGFGLLFWSVAIVGALFVMALTEGEKYSWTTGSLIITTALLCWIAAFNPFPWLLNNASTILYALLAYFVFGIAWGVTKWFFFLMRVRDKLVAYLKENGIKTPLSENDVAAFARTHLKHVVYGSSIPPKAAENKGRITFWMIYWPFSAPWTLINEPVKRFFNFIYNRIANLLQGMSDRLFRDLTN